MIKSLKSEEGNLADASIKKWSQTVLKIKTTFSKVEVVVPGHREVAGTAFLDYTIVFILK